MEVAIWMPMKRNQSLRAENTQQFLEYVYIHLVLSKAKKVLTALERAV